MDHFLKLDLQFFAESGENVGSENNTDPTANSEGQTEHTDTSNQEEPKPFTQEDVNNIAAKEAKKAQEKLLKQLGVDDFKSAKEGLSKLKEWQDSQKTEAEKQSEQLKEFETQNQTLASENESLKAQIAAVGAGVQTDAVQDVVTLAKPLVSDEVDMNAAIEKVLEKYPHFKGGATDEEPPVYTTGTHHKHSKLDSFASALLGKQ
ncbi:hypothetical protein PJ311_18425 [Bacillus sp. CLL-7-23]|uniref:Phage protein n=1 Tax=Bacillus changyiensis TaxID=3004103 RepID=A0ABT4X8A4_9BACI|nr:hypothetical protein [Bacillus changyiensis]MDA1477274.1 hypothetical protein [Bacillus changyiensis]MDA7028518.1 hypothetical protein [Bacillus changyiensis]